MELVKAMLVMARQSGEVVQVMLIDVKKAHLNGRVKDEDGDHYVKLPGDMHGECGALKRRLYGMRPAARAWEEDYLQQIGGEGLERGKAAPTAFGHAKTGTMHRAHGKVGT